MSKSNQVECDGRLPDDICDTRKSRSPFFGHMTCGGIDMDIIVLLLNFGALVLSRNALMWVTAETFVAACESGSHG